MKIEELETEKLLVLGLGREGLSSCKFLRRHFPNKCFAVADRAQQVDLSVEAKDWLSEQSQVDLILGESYLQKLEHYQVIIRTPGISLATAEIEAAKQKGTIFTSQSELFLSNCKGISIGVTGTKGKSTSSSLIYSMLKASGRNVQLLGNIGVPALEYLDRGDADMYVLEMSSYQLEGLSVSPNFAVLLGIFPEHLSYHGSFERYVEAKASITLNQSSADQLFYNSDSEIVRTIAARTSAVKRSLSSKGDPEATFFVGQQELCTRDQAGRITRLSKLECPGLKGDYNLDNIIAAAAVSHALGAGAEAIERALREFVPLAHRFEFVGSYRGIEFYNASLSTIPQATLAHLETLKGRVDTLLLGGHDRQLNFGALGQGILQARVRNLILFPDTGKRIWQAVQDAVVANPTVPHPKHFFVNSMQQAVELSYQHTAAGKVCLLSPASSSFGMFRDYKERGEQFKLWIEELGLRGSGTAC